MSLNYSWTSVIFFKSRRMVLDIAISTFIHAHALMFSTLIMTVRHPDGRRFFSSITLTNLEASSSSKGLIDTVPSRIAVRVTSVQGVP